MKNVFLKAYAQVFQFVAKERILRKDVPERFIHFHLVCVFATAILMWAYALVAYFYIEHPLPAIVGITASLAHILSPLLYRVSSNRFFNSNVFLGAGIIHQMTFAFFCGGFFSNITIWFGILPMLSGVISGRKGIVTWLAICTLVTLMFFILELVGFDYPYLISPIGGLISQALVTFGWIYASGIVIWVFIMLVEDHQKEIEKKKEGIENLICLITHDISTPLSVINGHSNLLKKNVTTNVEQASVDKIISATSNVSKIINSVRELYAMELGKKKIELSNIKLSEILSVLVENFEEKIETKKLVLNLEKSILDEEVEVITNGEILLHHVLGNILSNAIKFSQEGGEILISSIVKPDSAVIKIKDSGIGIPAVMIPKLFEMTTETSRIGTSGEKGTGFGLPIVKTSIEKLNGRVRVESLAEGDSAESHGTTFIIELPLANA